MALRFWRAVLSSAGMSAIFLVGGVMLVVPLVVLLFTIHPFCNYCGCGGRAAGYYHEVELE